MTVLTDPIKCRWSRFTVHRFERRPGGRLTSAWDLLRDHIYDEHPDQASKFGMIPDQVAADMFEWSWPR